MNDSGRCAEAQRPLFCTAKYFLRAVYPYSRGDHGRASLPVHRQPGSSPPAWGTPPVRSELTSSSTTQATDSSGIQKPTEASAVLEVELLIGDSRRPLGQAVPTAAQRPPEITDSDLEQVFAADCRGKDLFRTRRNVSVR